MAKKVDYSFHDVCFLFPEMSDQQIDELADDIKANGQLVPIVVHEDKIIDGRHRYVACGRAGVDPIYREWDGHGSMVAYVIALNRHRRHLTASQLAMVAAKSLPLFEAEAEERQKCTLKQNTPKNTENLPLASREANGGTKGKSAESAAKSVGASRGSVERAKKVIDSGKEDIIKAVEAGEITVTEAVRKVSKPEQESAPTTPNLDPNGIPIQSGQLAFESLEKFKELDSLVRKIESLTNDLAQMPGGERLQSNLQAKGADGKVRYRSTDLENFKSIIKFERPFTVCPYCAFGFPKTFKTSNSCGCCKGLGWATKQSFDNAPGDHKEAVEALKP